MPHPTVACIRKAGRIVLLFAGVLPGDDVLDVERDEGSRFLRQMAILASVAGTAAHQLACCVAHANPDIWRDSGGPWPE
jgi:hypothetical protein